MPARKKSLPTPMVTGEAAMPFIQGETLRDKLDREKQLGVGEAVHIATEVAAALQYAHEQRVIHRDILS